MAASNIQVNLKNNSGNVDILVDGRKGIEHNFDKQLILIHQPKQSPPLTLVNDIQRLREIVTIVGWLEDTDATSALAKKTTLRTILQNATNATIAWGSGATAQSYQGSIVKGVVKETSGKLGDEGSQGKIYGVILQFAIGSFRGG